MFDVGGGELLLILLAIIVLFGPKKIPEIVQMVGKGLSHLRKAQSEFQSHISEVKSEVDSQIKSVTEVVQESPKTPQVRQKLPDAPEEKLDTGNDTVLDEKPKDDIPK